MIAIDNSSQSAQPVSVDRIRKLIARELEQVLEDSGYYENNIRRAHLIGESRSGKQCYRTSFWHEGAMHVGHVYVWIDDGRLQADY
jgi:hypothetical protein